MRIGGLAEQRQRSLDVRLLSVYLLFASANLQVSDSQCGLSIHLHSLYIHTMCVYIYTYICVYVFNYTYMYVFVFDIYIYIHTHTSSFRTGGTVTERHERHTDFWLALTVQGSL